MFRRKARQPSSKVDGQRRPRSIATGSSDAGAGREFLKPNGEWKKARKEKSR